MYTFRRDPIYASSGTPGTTTDYNSLTNKPSINSHVLQGSMTLEQLGIQPTMSPITSEQIKDLSKEE